VTSETKVERLTRPQIKEAGQVLGQAFYDDPAVIYVEPDDGKRLRPLTWFMGTAVRYGHVYGNEVFVNAKEVQGVAIWLPPGGYPLGLARMIRAGILLAPQKLGLGPFVRFTRLMNWAEHLHKQNAPPQHWYLQWLGVDPPRQGQGIGSALMQPVLARADAAGLACYLETANARTLPLYQRHGFEVVTEGDAPKGGPHTWTMLRAPRG